MPFPCLAFLLFAKRAGWSVQRFAFFPSHSRHSHHSSISFRLFAVAKSQTVKAATKFGQMLRLATLRKMNSAVSRPQTAFFAAASLALICCQISSNAFPLFGFFAFCKKGWMVSSAFCILPFSFPSLTPFFNFLSPFCSCQKPNGQGCDEIWTNATARYAAKNELGRFTASNSIFRGRFTRLDLLPNFFECLSLVWLFCFLQKGLDGQFSVLHSSLLIPVTHTILQFPFAFLQLPKAKRSRLRRNLDKCYGSLRCEK